MNLELPSSRTFEPSSAFPSKSSNLFQAGLRLEPREFERLLQRAMEILNARDLEAQVALKSS